MSTGNTKRHENPPPCYATASSLLTQHASFMTCMAICSNWTLWSLQVSWKIDVLPDNAKQKSSLSSFYCQTVSYPLPLISEISCGSCDLEERATLKKNVQLTSSSVIACHLQSSLCSQDFYASCSCEHAVTIIWSPDQSVRLTVGLLQGGGTGQPLAPGSTRTGTGTNGNQQVEIGLAPTPGNY